MGVSVLAIPAPNFHISAQSSYFLLVPAVLAILAFQVFLTPPFGAWLIAMTYKT